MEPLDTIFLDARALKVPAERADFLAKACGADAGLRERVEAMLRDADNADAFFAPEDNALHGADSPLTEQPGTIIGRYKLLEQIGEGGMGVVYMAEQCEPVVRKVALKIIKLGMDTRLVVARFEAERQALALMDHPNIAKVFDGGATDSGRPYFVMELIQGLPITRFCAEANLPARARLELFLEVCSAIQHAHQKGIIHRDIKPSNVLVTLHGDKPVPKVIDFGIAKAVEERFTEKTLFTHFQQFIGTPAYVSPEQTGLTGLDIDTRTDVYSLGVLLYELLTGRTPFEGKELLKAGLDGMRRMICEKEPPRPSGRLTDLMAAGERRLPAKPEAGNPESEIDVTSWRRSLQEKQELIRLVRGDLDWIVMKCLEKNRARRYETVNGLAADIKRHLNDEPVIARPPTRRYRLQKALRRNKTAFGAGAAITATLLAAVAVSTFEAIRAKRAEAEQIHLRQQAEEAVHTAKQDERLASEEELLARRRFYAAQMNLAAQSWDAGQPARTLELLESQRPATKQPDLRNFEWFHLWGLCNAQLRFTLHGHAGGVTCVAFSPDGKTLASSSSDGTVRLWDLSAAQERRALEVQSTVSAVVFIPDGKTLASGSRDHLVRLWDVAAGRLTATLSGHPHWVRALAVSPDGRTLASGGDGGVVIRWDLAARTAQTNLLQNRMPVLALAFSSDGSALASGTGWNRERGATFKLNPVRDPSQPQMQAAYVSSLALSPDGKTLATASWQSIQLWDTVAGELRATLIGHSPPVNSLAFLPDGKTLASCAQDHTIRLWQMTSNTSAMPESVILGVHLDAVSCLAVSSDGTMLASGSTDGSIKLWNLAKSQADAQTRFATSFKCQIQPQSLSPWSLLPALNGNVVLITTSGGTEMRDIQSGQKLASLPDAAGLGALSPDGRLFATSEDLGVIKLWEIGTGRLLASVQAHPKASFAPAIAFSPDGRMIATGGFESDAAVRLWDVAAGLKAIRAIDTVGAGIDTVAFSPDGKWLAAAIRHQKVWIADASTGRMERIISLGSGAVETHATVFSPDGKLLATGGESGTVKLWDVQTGRLRAALKGHTATVFAIAFSPDGSTVASGSGDQTVKLWDVATGQERATLTRHHDMVKAVAFSPDGSALITVDRSGTGWILRATHVPLADTATAPVDDTEQSAEDSDRLAWVLATGPNADLRNGETALYLAEKEVAATHSNNPVYLDTLAAVYAELGQFTNAVRTERAAIALLQDEEQKEDFASRLRLYESNSPYRDHQ